MDAAWTSTNNPNDLTFLEQTDMLLGSTDPVAVSWYAAKFILTPIAVAPSYTNPDYNYRYARSLNRWPAFLADSAGFACTKDSYQITAYDRRLLNPDGDANEDGPMDPGDAVYILNYLFKAGPPPFPMYKANVNGDDTVDLGDAIYLPNYLFKGGPPPSC